MPSIFANIPVLSAIPNPLNLFSLDDSPARANNSKDLDDSRDSSESGPSSKGIKPILTRSGSDPSVNSENSSDGVPGRVPQRKVSGPASITIDTGVDSDTPRSMGSAIRGRPRGFSSASRISAVPGDNRKRRIKVETFILVKPPPTSGKNPLNLQVQLVMPDKKTRQRVPSDAAARAGLSGAESSAPSTPRRSFEDPKDVEEQTPQPPVTRLKRSNSVSSTRSSASTSASTGSSQNPGKRIVPLYNLAVHNVVQPTVVTDAGTDSKVAKFGKRQLDIAGVGILEPAEVWLPSIGQSPRPSMDASSQVAYRSNRPASMISTMSVLTPVVSRVDERVSSENGKSATPVKEDRPKKFFGKIFKKKSSAEPVADSAAAAVNALGGGLSGRGSVMVPSKSSNFLNVDAAGGGPGPMTLQVPSVPPSPQAPQLAVNTESAQSMSPSVSVQVGAPTFGLAPGVVIRRSSDMELDLSGAIVGLNAEGRQITDDDLLLNLQRSTRPVGYTWTVRRWAKKNTEGWAAHIVAAAAAGLDLVAGSLPADGSDEVVFEWVKLRLSASPLAAAALRRHPAGDAILTRRARRRSPPLISGNVSAAASPSGSRTSLALSARRRGTVDNSTSNLVPDTHGSTLGLPTAAGTSERPQPRRRNSASPTPPKGGASDAQSIFAPSELSFGALSSPACEVVIDHEDGYDSDPEDSETPWLCSVWIKRTGKRQMLATLTPAPHHPKVIGVLRIPQSIKSISLAEVPVSAANIANTAMAARVCEEVALTEENLKDVVNVTAMWLVAREEFGGLGRKRK